MQEHKCECSDMCPYFNSEKMSKLDLNPKLLQQDYCLKDNSKCARYMIFRELGSESIPDSLLPFEEERAEQIIESAEIVLLA